MRLPTPLTTVALRPASFVLPRVWSSRLALVGLTLLGFGLRLPLLDRFPFREDEAIYSFWALHFARNDPLLLTVWPDKPPLFLWLLAGAFGLLGASQASAQLLNVAISILTVPVVAAIAHALWGRRSALVAALVMSLSPFAISFAPTAFTDPLLVLSGLLALRMALARRPFWAAFWLGAAIMTKQQGLLYAPLVGAALYWAAERRSGQLPRTLALFLGGLGVLALPIIYWDSMRWAVAPSPWALSAANYGTLTLAPLVTWPSRLVAWFELIWQLAAGWPVWIALTMLAGGWLWQRQLGPSPVAALAGGQSGFARSLVLWSCCFVVLHVVTTVQIWDRYLLPLAPPLALAAAGLLRRWLSTSSAGQTALALTVALLLCWSPAVQAAQGRLPIGSDHGAYSGLREALAWLRTQAQDAALDDAADQVVLYHQSLGWHYRFYLFDAVNDGRYDLRWYPSAVYLADNAAKSPQRARVLIVPDWTSAPALAQQLAVRGLALDEGRRFGNFTLYTVQEQTHAVCAWCLCQPRPPFPLLQPKAAIALSQRSERP